MLTELFFSMDNDMPPYFYRIASDWVSYFSRPEQSIDNEHLNPFHIYEMVVRYEPFWALGLIVETIKLDKTGASIEILIDGPLTEFVNSHGKVYLDDIVSSIKSSKILKDAMKSVKNVGLDEGSWLTLHEAIYSD